MSLSTTWRWALLALLGLAIAIGVAFVASELTSQRIGLASEPLRAGEELAPAEIREDRGDGEATSTTVDSPTTTTERPGPDDSERGEEGSGEVRDEREDRGEDDD